MCVELHRDMCMDMFVGMCVETHDICVGMHTDRYFDMCINLCVQASLTMQMTFD